MFYQAPAPLPRALRGVAMIEVLAAMLVFAMGVLALVGLQGSLMRAQTDSKVRADASYLAGELLGKMWSDPKNFKSFDAEGCAEQVSCKEWQDKVAGTLPGGSGTVTVDSASGDVNVTVTWSVPGGEQHKYETHSTINTADGN